MRTATSFFPEHSILFQFNSFIRHFHWYIWGFRICKRCPGSAGRTIWFRLTPSARRCKGKVSSGSRNIDKRPEAMDSPGRQQFHIQHCRRRNFTTAIPIVVVICTQSVKRQSKCIPNITRRVLFSAHLCAAPPGMLGFGWSRSEHSGSNRNAKVCSR